MKFLSIEKVWKQAGGAVGIQNALFRSGQDFPSRERIFKWKARNSIPGSWAGAVIYALAAKGVNPLSLLSDADTANQDEGQDAA